jgi:tripartite-type tricarboxylate transporter receptor subunit TctC
VTSITALSALPVFDKNPGYRSPEDFEPLSLATRTPAVWCVSPSVPVKNLREFVAYAKSNPGKLNYASFGTNSSSHLAQEDFFRILDLQITHVPFKGESEGLNALLAGQVQVMMISGAAAPHIKSGKLVALATTTENRWGLLPDVPTARETRVPELATYMYEPWIGFSTSAGVPKDVVAKLAAAVRQALNEPAARATLEGLGNRVVASSISDMNDAVISDLARYHVLTRSGRVSPS